MGDAADATYTETANFQSCKDTLHTNASKTLVDSANRPHSSLSADVTLADSCVDSLVSCAETLVGDSDPNLETCARPSGTKTKRNSSLTTTWTTRTLQLTLTR